MFEKVRDIIVETLSCEADEVTMEASLTEDLGALLRALHQGGEGDLEAGGDLPQGGDGGAGLAPLDLTQHALAHAGALRRLAEAQVHITTQIFQIVRDDRIHIRHKIIGVHDSSQAFLSLVRR